jgi:hypothetical protein
MRTSSPLRRSGLQPARHRDRRHGNALVRERLPKAMCCRSYHGAPTRRFAFALSGARPRRAERERRSSAWRSPPGVERRGLHRGDVLVTAGAFPVSYRLDVELEGSPRSKTGRVSPSTTAPRGSPPGVARRPGTAQLRLEAPVVAARGGRVVLRGETTLGGAGVDPARRVASRSSASSCGHGDPASIVARPWIRQSRSRRLLPVGCSHPPRLEAGLTAVVPGRRLGLLAGVARGHEQRRDRSAAGQGRGVAARAGPRSR